MAFIEVMLLGFLIICAVVTVIHKSIMMSILTYMGFGLVMTVVWMLLQAPDLAITEAAVGAGVSTVLYFLTLRKIRQLRTEKGNEDKEASGEEAGE